MKTFFTAAIALTASSQALAADIRVIDGDTIELNRITYRLHGIDAPEVGQSCKTARGTNWACGKAAVEVMEDLVLGASVACEAREDDGYGRTLAVCYADGTDINAEMVRQGYAWAFRRYAMDYAALEDQTRAARLGVWAAQSQAPWDYRAQKWNVAEQQAPDGCPIKGNISSNGRIYHAPWSPWYSRTKITVAKGERWFCNEADAVQAGWRPPYWGR
ncbi:thermonuclease family protein [Stappia sp. MMSF_3263]|uniref:thermonuclease family protein n=1 Tax=Stappia sp. MMSF_3263 TaxID=3046693 RepID=UPI00273EDC8C|nr:thermonuclease family protein [Stappia sp. MMSF_3263]